MLQSKHNDAEHSSHSVKATVQKLKYTQRGDNIKRIQDLKVHFDTYVRTND